MNRAVISRSGEGSSWPRAGEWAALGGDDALVACPECGQLATLTDHEIRDADGAVHPSLVCPKQECGWHEYIRLEGWNND